MGVVVTAGIVAAGAGDVLLLWVRMYQMPVVLPIKSMITATARAIAWSLFEGVFAGGGDCRSGGTGSSPVIY